MHTQLTFGHPLRLHMRPDLAPVFALLAPRIRDVVVKTHEALTAAGIRHALAGGLAVGAHGHPRATKDVDFLVGDEAFIEHGGGLVTLHPALPIAIGDIPIDAVPVPKEAPFLAEALEHPDRTEGIPVVPIEALVCMKLLAMRPRDRRDIEELVLAGMDVKRVRRHVLEHLPDLAEEFDRLVGSAEAG
jgi:hypothetical protein